jgi:hypothetical protein
MTTVVKEHFRSDPERWKEYLLFFSRFGEIERIKESKIPDISSAKTKDLW